MTEPNTRLTGGMCPLCQHPVQERYYDDIGGTGPGWVLVKHKCVAVLTDRVNALTCELQELKAWIEVIKQAERDGYVRLR